MVSQLRDGTGWGRLWRKMVLEEVPAPEHVSDGRREVKPVQCFPNRIHQEIHHVGEGGSFHIEALACAKPHAEGNVARVKTAGSVCFKI